MPSTNTQPANGQRHIAPIRWPKPNAFSIGLLAIWLLGVVVGVGLPALVVAPTEVSPAQSAVLTAFAITVVGVLVMLTAALLLYRRYREAGLLVFAFVPSAAVLAGGFIFMGLKIFT